MLARRGTSRGRRKAVVAAASVAIVAMFVVATALPAWAHHPVLSGTTVCSDGEHVISWTIGNSEAGFVMHIDSATAVLGAQTFAVTGYTPNVAKLGSTSATTTVPGGSTGTVTLTVHATWTDGATATRTTAVTLSSQCSGPTTTTSTTIGGGTTTTIGGGTTTTSTTIEGATSTTSTTIEGETSTTSTTISGETSTSIGGSTTSTTGGTVGTQGSTSPTSTPVTANSTPTSDSSVTANSNPTGLLPFTGGSNTGPIFGLASLAVGGVALALASRKKRSRDS